MSSRHSASKVRSPCLPCCDTAIVLVDFINPLDFAGGDRLLPEAFAAAQATLQLKQRLASRGVSAIYANDNYGSWQSNFRDVLDECQELPGQRGEMARLLAPGQADLTLLKPRHSAFFATPLDMLLREMGVKNLVLTGLVTDMCVHFTAVDAFMRGYRLWVPGNCVAAETATAQRTGLRHMERRLRCCTHSSRGRSPFKIAKQLDLCSKQLSDGTGNSVQVLEKNTLPLDGNPLGPICTTARIVGKPVKPFFAKTTHGRSGRNFYGNHFLKCLAQLSCSWTLETAKADKKQRLTISAFQRFFKGAFVHF